METEFARIREEALQNLEACRTEEELEALRIRYLGRKGALTLLLRGLRDLPPEKRPEIGRQANEVKSLIEERLETLRLRLREQKKSEKLATERTDVTLPGKRRLLGRLHPLTQVIEEAVEIFRSMGFGVAQGPDIEDDYHNFEALNIPKDHPARDMQDTFFLAPELVLRTHTSPVQIRVMESQKPPLRVIVPGAVYRHDHDATHSPMFFQIEGFMVDQGVSFAHLKGVLTAFVQRMFGQNTKVRFRPSYFPFTEPSAEVDISCALCLGKGQGCPVCGGSGWLEILGSGMIHPNVFRSVGYNPESVSGFAFGMGMDRIAMLKYGIPNIRLFYENDLRFLRQF